MISNDPPLVEGESWSWGEGGAYRFSFHEVDPYTNIGYVSCWFTSPTKLGIFAGKIEFGYPMNSRQRRYDTVLGWVRVPKRFQRRGIGSELYKTFLKWNRERRFFVEMTKEGLAFVKAFHRKNPDLKYTGAAVDGVEDLLGLEKE